MNQPDAATCLCIISHPTKTEFMVVKHSDRWSPPVVMMPMDGHIPNLAKYVTDGISRDYGLRTIALRQLVSTPGYHCIELEMTAPKGSKNLRAHWVGAREYRQFRSSVAGQLDPIAQWLKEKKKGRIPALRPSWAMPGFFIKARHWINHQLDTLNIQATGSVEQFDAFKTGSHTLRVPTHEGWIYFRAGSEAMPYEAALTSALATRWPDHVPAPLSVDRKKNWMLLRDHRIPGEDGAGYQDYPEIASIMARIQLESQPELAEWQKLGCPALGLDHLADFAGKLDHLTKPLSEGGGIALTDSEIEVLTASGKVFQELIEKLSEYSVPDMLVHTNLRPANVFKREGKLAIVAWSGSVVGHPFFSVLKLIGPSEPNKESPDSASTDGSAEEGRVNSILTAYLEPFAHFESPDRLLEAMSLVRQLENLWNLYGWSQVISQEEHESVMYQSAVRQLQQYAHAIIRPGQTN